MLTDEQLREHDKELNLVNDVLTTVMSSVRQAYPAEDRANSIIKDALDVINRVQQLRSKLRNLELPSNRTDIDTIFHELEKRVLGLDGVQQTSNRKSGRRAYKAPTMMSRQFVSIGICKRHLAVYLRIPPDKISDPSDKCMERKPGEWSHANLSSVADLDYFMELVQQAYNYNLIK